MVRLTERDKYGSADLTGVDTARLTGLGTNYFIKITNALTRLAAYEDTGLTPEDCANLKQELVTMNNCKLFSAYGMSDDEIQWIAAARRECRLIVLPSSPDVTIEDGGLIYKGDHWNPPQLTAFADDPTTRTGKRVGLFSLNKVKAAIEAQKGADNERNYIPWEAD